MRKGAKKILLAVVVLSLLAVSSADAKRFKGGRVFDPKRYAEEIKNVVEWQKIQANIQQLLSYSEKMRSKLVFIFENSEDVTTLGDLAKNIFQENEVLDDFSNYDELEEKYKLYTIEYDQYAYRQEMKRTMESQKEEERKKLLSEQKEIQKAQKEHLELAQKILNQSDEGILSERQKNNLLAILDLQGQNLSISQKVSALSKKSQAGIFESHKTEIAAQDEQYLYSLDPYNKSEDEKRLSPTKKVAMPKFYE